MSKPIFDFPVASDFLELLCHYAERAAQELGDPAKHPIDAAVVGISERIREQLDKQAMEIKRTREANAKDQGMN
jgi:hypothetical protein